MQRRKRKGKGGCGDLAPAGSSPRAWRRALTQAARGFRLAAIRPPRAEGLAPAGMETPPASSLGTSSRVHGAHRAGPARPGGSAARAAGGAYTSAREARPPCPAKRPPGLDPMSQREPQGTEVRAETGGNRPERGRGLRHVQQNRPASRRHQESVFYESEQLLSTAAPFKKHTSK